MTRPLRGTAKPLWYGREFTRSPLILYVAGHKILRFNPIPEHPLPWHQLGLVVRGELHLQADGARIRLPARHFVLFPQGSRLKSAEGANTATVYWVGLGPASPNSLAAFPTLGAELEEVGRQIVRNELRVQPAPEELIQAVARAFERVDGGCRSVPLLQAAAFEIIGQLHEALRGTPPREDARTHLGLVRPALELIHAHPEVQPALSELAGACRLSRTTFSESFRHALGVPPHEYINRWKTERAEELLRERGATVSRVARTLGYSSPQHFAKVFKRLRGHPPSTLRA
jgi:AraC-like DNA-binding protein